MHNYTCVENTKLLHIKISGIYNNGCALNGTLVIPLRAVTRNCVDKFAVFKGMTFFATLTCLLKLRYIRKTKQESKSIPLSLNMFRK
jgi:tmRNA-binding protein